MRAERHQRTVGDTTVTGLGMDAETRCTHYDSPRDVVAIRFACCGVFYPCVTCHDSLVEHDRTVWSADEFDTRAILCGVCGTRLAIRTYLDAGDVCPSCGAGFNPNCREHYPCYFDGA